MEECIARCIDIYTDAIDDILDFFVEFGGEELLVYIMLILSYPYSFGIHLGKLCERILGTMSDTDSTTYRHVQMRIFFLSQNARTIYRRSCFRHNDVFGQIIVFCNHIRHKLLRFTACSAISYDDHVDLVGIDYMQERCGSS